MADHLKKYRDKAKQLMRLHKGLSYTDAMKKAGTFFRSGKSVGKVKKAAAKKPAARKKSVPVKAYKRKANRVPAHSRTIGSIALSSIQDQQTKREQLKGMLNSLSARLKDKGLSATEKAALRRDILHTKNVINSCTKHINQLKKSI